MIKAVVFDLDHTLFDRHATLAAIVPLMREKFDLNNSLSDEEIAKYWAYGDDNYVYLGWKYIFAYLCENDVFKTAPTYDDYCRFVIDSFGKIAVKNGDSLPMLRELKETGYKVALITNGRHALQYKKLELLGLSYIFDEIIVSGDTDTEKPEKEIFLIMTEKLGVKPEECVYVGDNPVNDIDGARKAGFHTVWIRSTNNWNEKIEPAEESISELKTLPEVIKSINFRKGTV